MTLTLRSWTAACSAGALLLALGTSGAAAASSEGVAPRAACAVPQASSDADALGEQLTQRFLRLLKKRDVPGLRGFLAPNFQIMRSNGVADTKRSYLKKDLPVIESFTIKGYAMDDERLKNDGSILTKQYFEEQLQRIREIRLSERKFYQKITDIYATSIDYDFTAAATKRFFATVQNKLHWAIHGKTAAEVIVSRADATKDSMGLTTWKDAPSGKIQKFDVVVAKNYLTENELAQLQRLVSAYLDVAESMALREIPMTMQDWETRLNRFIAATDREILQDAGKVSAEIAEAHALS